MVKILILSLLLLVTSIFTWKNPEILHQITLSSTSSPEFGGDKTSCFNSALFLLQKITSTDAHVINTKLMDMKNNFKKLDEFENDFKKKINSNNTPIIYTFLLSQADSDHYFILEYYHNYIYLFQSFQGAYSFGQKGHIKIFKYEEFIKNLNTIITEKEKVNAIHNLFCFDDIITTNCVHIFGDKQKSCSYILAYFFLDNFSFGSGNMYLTSGLEGDNERLKNMEEKLQHLFKDASKLTFKMSFFNVGDELELKNLKDCIPKKNFLNSCLIN